MVVNAFQESLEKASVKSLSLTRLQTYCLVLHLALFMLCGCGVTVYRDGFDSTAIGQPPGPPQIGTSSINGDVLIAENPTNDVSPDRWLELRRPSATGTLGEYVGTFKERVTATGRVRLLGYIPAFAPAVMSVHFEALGPASPLTLLHIDLLADGKIRVNDSTIVGTYQFDTIISFSVRFNLGGASPSATLNITDGVHDASAAVAIPASPAGFGLGQVRIVTAFEGVNSAAGQFLVNEVVATKPRSD